MQQSSTCWLYSGRDKVEQVDAAETERLWEREADSGVEDDTEEDEVLLDPDPEPELEEIPEVSREDREVHSQN